MSKPSRMLLVLAIFSVTALAVLGMMAQRYGSVLERRDKAERIAERRLARSAERVPRPIGEPRPRSRPVRAEAPRPAERSDEDEALRFVDAYIQVRRALHLADTTGEPDAALQGALDEAGLAETDYSKVEKLLAVWRDGRAEIGRPFSAAFEQRREELDRLGL